MLQYVSTRGLARPVFFCEALRKGIADDGGLYVPVTYPLVTDKWLNAMRNPHTFGYQQVAMNVLRMFMPDIPPGDLARLVGATYTAKTFGSLDITPLDWFERGRLYRLRLAEGPTFAFKDVAMQLLAKLLEYVYGQNTEGLNILSATSGDTGSSAEEAFQNKPNMNVFMLSPYGRMSPVQRKQMYANTAANIFNLAVRGTFDDCQGTVKAVFRIVKDYPVLKAKLKLGTVNSINWARIAAQVVYYFYAYLCATKSNGERVTFVVPSGNFGNALAAYIAKQMGLPIDLIVATNGNDVLDEVLHTGVYRVRERDEVKVTSSPSMDICEASNFERLLFDANDRNPSMVRQRMATLAQTRQYKDSRLIGFVGIRSSWASEQEVLDTIKLTYDRYGKIIDPHTAVAMCVGLRFFQPGMKMVIVETAQWAKFPETIREALGFEPPMPEALRRLMDIPEDQDRVRLIDPDPAEVIRIIEEHVH